MNGSFEVEATKADLTSNDGIGLQITRSALEEKLQISLLELDIAEFNVAGFEIAPDQNTV